ncbi:MAG: neutral/alkaline non-lysosomal ceramidase N-terminal domain-containing protein, partial [Myxococcota bacterium]
AGAEDGRSFLAELCPRRVREGVRIRPGAGDPNDVQYPKRLALAPLQRLLKRTRLVIAPDHPVHYAELRAGNDAHAIFTVPGEPTVVASHRIERALLQGITASGRESASALACAGDYAGYVTTPEEYAEQHYEGASTLFGRETLPHLVGTLQALAAQNVIRSRSRTVVEPLRARDVLRDARGLPGRLARRPWLLDDDGRRELVVAGGIVPHLLARRGRVAATKTAKVPHLKVRIAAYDRSGLRRTSRLRKLEEPD